MKFVSNKQWEDFQLAVKELPRLAALDKREAEYKNSINQLEHDRKQMKETFELEEKKAVSAMEDKVSKDRNELENSHQKEIVELKARHQKETNDLVAIQNEALVSAERRSESKYNKQLEELTTRNLETFKTEISKLHSEGNIQTKSMHEMSMQVLKTAQVNLNAQDQTKTNVHQVEHQSLDLNKPVPATPEVVVVEGTVKKTRGRPRKKK